MRWSTLCTLWSDTPEQVWWGNTSGCQLLFYTTAPRAESRPVDVQREGEGMRAMGGGESYESSSNLGCACLKKRRRRGRSIRRKRRRRRRLSGADWVLRGRKNKQVVFLIKESLKERVGELWSWGKRLRSKQAESFLYTHFLWFWALWEQEAGWNYVLVYAILHHLYSHSVCSLSHSHSWCMWLHENTWEQTVSYAWSLYVLLPITHHLTPNEKHFVNCLYFLKDFYFIAISIPFPFFYVKPKVCSKSHSSVLNAPYCFECISMQSVFTWRSMRKCSVLFTK